MTRRIVIFDANGSERELSGVPSLQVMKAIVGGSIEHVRVLDLSGEYTSMFVNETGLIDGLPRNAKATEAYQRNIRAAYPNSAQPFREAHERWRASLPINASIHDVTPETAIAAGYKDDPWIAGPAILFEGWTCEEVDEAMA